MKTPKDPVVSASPAPEENNEQHSTSSSIKNSSVDRMDSEAKAASDGWMLFASKLVRIIKDAEINRAQYMLACELRKLAAAQPVAANLKVEDTLPRNKWTPCPICKSDYDGKFCHACRNEPVELVMQLIDATASTGAYFTSEEFKEQLAAILGPFFTQVSQPARDTESEFRAWMADHSTTDYIGGELHPRAAIEFAEHYAKPVTPVSGNGTEPPLIVRCHCCKGTQIWKRNDAGEVEVYHDCASGLHAAKERIKELEAGAASHNGQGWVRVEDRLPEPGTVSMVYCKESEDAAWQDIGTYSYHGGWHVTEVQDANRIVTHWQPLPAPPSEGPQPTTKHYLCSNCLTYLTKLEAMETHDQSHDIVRVVPTLTVDGQGATEEK